MNWPTVKAKALALRYFVQSVRVARKLESEADALLADTRLVSILPYRVLTMVENKRKMARAWWRAAYGFALVRWGAS